MTVVKIPFDSVTYMINTSDISGSKVAGVSVIGAKVFDVNSKRWYISGSDLFLNELTWMTGSYTPGMLLY